VIPEKPVSVRGRKKIPSMYSIRGPHRAAPKDGGEYLDGVIITRV
jgi:hypothetical protein